MAECEYINTCPFPLGKMEARDDVDVEKMKEEYCLSNNLHCARYMVAMAVGEDRVPADLYPHEKDKAYTLIAELG